MSKRPIPPGPESHRRFSLPFEESIDGDAYVHYAAILDRCAIIAPNGNVKIGAARLEQCVIVEPCVIGDDVVAVAAILQGEIGDGTRIEAHADIQGTVGERCIIRRGVLVSPGAFVEDGAELGDLTVVHEGAEIGSGARVGPQSDVGDHAVVPPDARLPARTVVRPEGLAIVPADERQGRKKLGGGGDPEVPVRLVVLDQFDDEPQPEDESHGEDEEEDEAEEARDGFGAGYDAMDLAALVPADYSARPGDMAKGRPKKILTDFQPGTARSWALSKLGRLANLHSKDGRLTKALVQRFRPDLLELPITKEVLRISPPVTDAQLAEMSMGAVSPAHYDVWTGITFHSGGDPQWQMLGPKTNDVFILSVPDRVMSGLTKKLERGRWEWKSTGDFLSLMYTVDGAEVEYAVIEKRPRGFYRTSTLHQRYDEWYETYEQMAVGRGDYEDLEDAKRNTEGEARALLRGDLLDLTKRAFHVSAWHPDRLVKNSVGWVRTLVYPRQTVLVVEIQSDRPWMGFKFSPSKTLSDTLGAMLREMYYEHFAGDALNVVVEWAFSNRYSEVLVLDHDSRKKLGGTPPKSFYDAVPKKYMVGELEPLLTPATYIRTYDWVPRDLRVRRIVPNGSVDHEVRALIERIGFPLIRRILVKRYTLKQCGYISQEFVNAVAREGIPGEVVDSGAHAVALVRLPTGTWEVDLSYAQFLCDIDDDDQLGAMIDRVSDDPWTTVRYERVD